MKKEWLFRGSLVKAIGLSDAVIKDRAFHQISICIDSFKNELPPKVAIESSPKSFKTPTSGPCSPKYPYNCTHNSFPQHNWLHKGIYVSVGFHSEGSCSILRNPFAMLDHSSGYLLFSTTNTEIYCKNCYLNLPTVCNREEEWVQLSKNTERLIFSSNNLLID